MFSLVRATIKNGHFTKLEDQWRDQASSLSEGVAEEPEDYFATMMDHARRIAEEDPEDPKYGIFTLINENAGGGPAYEGLVHINHKLPRTSKACVRMVWNILAPHFDYDQQDLIANVMASYIMGGLKLCRSEMKSSSMQMYLLNGTDRQYAVGAVSLLRELDSELRVNVRGMWLHIDNIA
ncbi:hypothetical protein ACIU1J_05445 [Azospirillum doebereinerae]|uniref:hypothetical protein n=1 Tax=Azospirillum doebereinerae TaxID=92933 RepID=UPI001EE60FC8|nr:hypothetical protein [Azospirillum doebereinerae]MCG5240860.1 hypothetical protein [Azospirillum doebereinerae]